MRQLSAVERGPANRSAPGASLGHATDDYLKSGLAFTGGGMLDIGLQARLKLAQSTMQSDGIG
jgi:hypothetical protein